jgi:hypothetical protein
MLAAQYLDAQNFYGKGIGNVPNAAMASTTSPPPINIR